MIHSKHFVIEPATDFTWALQVLHWALFLASQMEHQEEMHMDCRN